MRRGILSHCLRIFFICWAIGTFYILFEEIVPVTRRHFLSYQDFQKRADFAAFEKELPKSAHDIKYYVYSGFLVDKSGYRVSYSQEDYEMVKKSRWDSQAPFIDIEGVYCYDGINKQYLDWQKLEERRINFLNQLLPEEQDNGCYYILTYSFCETREVYHFGCVLCNDETCEMIELSYYGPT